MTETDQELRDLMARTMRRMQRIIRLQSSLNVRLQTARTVYEQASLKLWQSENGYKLQRDLQSFSSNDAERATAALIAFNPMSRKTRRNR